ncbi:MAG: AAA domain-containing protein [Thermodesulfobacteriota bacterium]
MVAPGITEKGGQNKPALFNSALVGLIQWENQELIRDLEDLSKMGDLNGAAADLLRGIEQKAPSCLSVPEEVDRYFVTDTDVSQERAVWMARTESGVVVHGPPGTGKSQVIVNIVADSLAHGQRVLVICQKKAALDVVASRLNAAGLGNLFLQVDDAEADRRRTVEALKSQERPLMREVEAYRKEIALTISRLEQELETYRKALFDIRPGHGICYPIRIGELLISVPDEMGEIPCQE